MDDHRTTATIYCDASYARDRAGIGAVARIGTRLIAVSRLCRFEVDSSLLAEGLAVAGALETVHALMPDLRKAVIRTDCDSVVRALRNRRLPRILREVVPGIKAFAENNGIELDVRWVRGHKADSAEGHANGIAHRLAVLARHGEDLSYSTGFGIDWRRALTRLDPRLVALEDHECVPFDAVAGYLSVSQSTVADLIRHGHLDYLANGVTLQSMHDVMRAMMRMRQEMMGDHEMQPLLKAG